MRKRIIFTLVGLVIVVAILGGIKAMQIGAMIEQGKKFVPPPETVTSVSVKADSWETSLTAVGTLNAVQGVTVGAELTGKVVKIAFDSGTSVNKGDILIRQDTSAEEAQLPGAVAQADLSRTNLDRAEQLFAKGMIARVDLDIAAANAAQALAQVENIKATIAKKTIRAPFSGQLGIRQVNLGQILREGDPIVTLQSLDSIYVDFTLPQQQLALVKSGLPVLVTSDAAPGVTIEGRITAMNPLVDPDTRNIKVEATVTNRGGKLRPGMFVNVTVGLPTRRNVLAVPSTAILYAPYGDSVFVIEAQGATKNGKEGNTLRQQFVRLGERLGDFVAVTSGLKDGETIVSTGVFKLRNGQSVVVDNALAPSFQKQPMPENN
ncbi:MAG TPA: efflux RND transporter periplasmic adaptor subunit [Thermodesulfovibrionales bacterium]|nr:efflux RND transporter periplasmic adaptor subunit [Thermodesulfovibrionales bacterium]